MFSGIKVLVKQLLLIIFLSQFLILKIIIRKINIFRNSIFLKQFQNNIFSNIIYISGADFKSCKIEDIRNLKKKFYNPHF